MDKLVETFESMSDEEFCDSLKRLQSDELEFIKTNLDNRYFNTAESTISDLKYDILIDYIKEINPSLIQPIGCKAKESVPLPYKLGGMDKIKKEKEMVTWSSKCDSFVISNKLDGVSCLVIFSDKGISLYTRGDGTHGADISHLHTKIKGIVNIKRKLAIRGEIVVDKKTFQEKYSGHYKTQLSFVVGTVNSKTVKESASDLQFIAYEIVSDPYYNPSKNLELLKEYGFNIVQYSLSKKINFTELQSILSTEMQKYTYFIDGLVIYKNEPYDRLNVASTGNPRYAIAFKMVNQSAETIVANVIWTASKWGYLKPVVAVEKVKLGGSTIAKVTGFNAKYIVDNKINIGSKVLIVKSGEVIPHIEKVLSFSDKPLLPTFEYEWNDTKVDFIVKDTNQDAILIKQLVHFFTTMDIKHINEGIVKKMVEKGYNSINLILATKIDQFESLPGVKKPLATKLYNSIHESLKSVEMYKLMTASCVFNRGLGEKKLKKLLEKLPNIVDEDVTIKDICRVEGFSEKSAKSVLDKLEDFRIFYGKISKFVCMKK